MSFRPVRPRFIQRALPFTAALAMLSAIGAQPAWAASGSLEVSARVLPFTRVHLQAPPPTLAITAEDVERGYVDAPAPLAFGITSNSGQGATLLFEPRGPHVLQASVSGLNQPLRLGSSPQALRIPMPERGLSRLAVQLRFRFYLAAGTPAGVHPWPLQVSTEVL